MSNVTGGTTVRFDTAQLIVAAVRRVVDEERRRVSALDRQRVLVLRDLVYLGGHPGAPSALDRIDVFFDDDGVRFERRHEPLGAIPWNRISEVAADAESVRSHMTVPRVWLLGILAAVFPKRDRNVLLRVSDDRGAWMFEVGGIGLGELRVGLDQIRRRYLG